MQKLIIPTSLNLLKINALNADLLVNVFVNQKLIKKKDVIPISSHPNIKDR